MAKPTTSTILSVLLVAISSLAFGQSDLSPKSSTVHTSDGVSIAYEVHGQGSTALILVHGWSCDRSYWKEQVPHFSKRFKVVTIDLGGHGDSGLGRSDWTIYSFGNDVATVVRELDLRSAILIGHSMGGDVVVDAALQLPNIVVGLIMVDTYKELGNGRSMEQVQAIVDEFSTDFQKKVQNLVRNMYLPQSNSPLVDHIANDMSSAPSDVALSSLKSSFTHSRQITHDLQLLNLPVIAINADYEPTDIESMESHGVRVVIMPGVKHFLLLEEPERFNELLENTINKLLGE